MKLTVVFEYCEAMETYSRIWVLRGYRNLQSYLSTTRLWKLTVVFEYCEAMETCSRIWALRGYGNLQSYLSTARLWKLTVVFEYCEDMETCSRIWVLLKLDNNGGYCANSKPLWFPSNKFDAKVYAEVDSRFNSKLNFTRFECSFNSSLVSTVVLIIHSFRV